MKQIIIENPVLNSAFMEPDRHFRFTEEGITDEIVDSRRVSAYFVPIAPPKKKGKQGRLPFETEWTQDRLKENKFINRVRERDVVPGNLMEELGKAKIIITNFHAFKARERNDAGRLTKKLLSQGKKARLQKHPTRWCVGYAGIWELRKTLLLLTMKPTTVTVASPTAKMPGLPARNVRKRKNGMKRPVFGFPDWRQ